MIWAGGAESWEPRPRGWLYDAATLLATAIFAAAWFVLFWLVVS